MALQLTPMSGTTAYMDRMGNQFPDLVASGRIVQGYSVSGPLDDEAVRAIDQDLADGVWRNVFHDALRDNRRFQRGLFDLSHGIRIGAHLVPGPAAFLKLVEDHRKEQGYSLGWVREWSRRPCGVDEGYAFEYGLALVKTAAALLYTIRLATRHGLEAVTDSEPHFHLLQRTCAREGQAVTNRLRAG